MLGFRNIFEESLIKIEFVSNDFKLNQYSISFIWFEPYNRFEIRIKPEHIKQFGIIDICIYGDDLLISSSRITIAIGNESKNKSFFDAPFISEVFASYAREDYQFVNHMKSRYKALGIYMFKDIQDMRAGVNWEENLLLQIEKSNLFQLFWSEYSRDSKYVKFEYEKALELIFQGRKNINFIRPFCWKKPIPKIPKKLSHINFYFLNQAVEEVDKFEIEDEYIDKETNKAEQTTDLFPNSHTSPHFINFDLQVEGKLK